MSRNYLDMILISMNQSWCLTGSSFVICAASMWKVAYACLERRECSWGNKSGVSIARSESKADGSDLQKLSTTISLSSSHQALIMLTSSMCKSRAVGDASDTASPPQRCITRAP